MIKIKTLNKISNVGLEKFTNNYAISNEEENPDGILVRSEAMHEMAFNKELLAIARAGAGVNNIPVDRCSKEGIVVFNTPGANANGVKELVICGLMLASRDIIDGSMWINTLKGDIAPLVEKGKNKFAGSEIKGKTLGIIGLGAIGGMVANTAIHLDMDVIGYDPFISVENAWKLNHHIRHASGNDEIYKVSDYITLHIPYTQDTKGIINKETISHMKDGVKILNFSRAELVDFSDLKEALDSGKVSRYVTDFPTNEIVGYKGVVTIPHLGASTLESEDNCAIMAALELMDYIENGNIKNSVNFPSVSSPRAGDFRLCILNDNIPDVISSVTKVLSSIGLNIENLSNKSKGNYAYTILDVSGRMNKEKLDEIKKIKGVIRLRLIH
ncbi:3-phosphoglycerate dehydrogenase [bacterium]|nr:3-phosphoglycerate dehydrogenase [bacterium]